MFHLFQLVYGDLEIWKKSIKMENIRKIFLKMEKGIFALSSTWWYGRE